MIEHLKAIGHPVAVCFEATGNYHRPLAWHLVAVGFDVYLIASVVLARTREALHNGWDKNEPKDAQVMLYMLSAGQIQHYYDPLAHQINDWQELSTTHEAISKAKTETLHRLQTHYFPLYFPEVDRFRNSSRALWFFQWLHKFLTPKHILALSKDECTHASWKLIGRKINKAQLLHDIYAAAQSSIGISVERDCAAVTMYQLVIEQIDLSPRN